MPVDPLFLPSGTLRHQITVLYPSQITDAAGQTLDEWTALLTTMASIRKLSYKELAQSEIISSQAIWEIKIRFQNTPISSGMQVKCGAQTWYVQDAEDIDLRHRVIKLTCVEINAATNQ